jgi:hypothetical protein
MRKILLTTALAALLPAAAMAMPVAPAMPGAAAAIPVQGLPEYYRWDPCAPGAPPVRLTITDSMTGQPMQTTVPASRFCRGGGYGRPAPRYYDDRPAYRPAPRYYDDDQPVYRQRRAPPPGWERDPYTGRDMRILR